MGGARPRVPGGAVVLMVLMVLQVVRFARHRAIRRSIETPTPSGTFPVPQTRWNIRRRMAALRERIL
jgi:hypothetical protein